MEDIWSPPDVGDNHARKLQSTTAASANGARRGRDVGLTVNGAGRLARKRHLDGTVKARRAQAFFQAASFETREDKGEEWKEESTGEKTSKERRGETGERRGLDSDSPKKQRV